MTQHPETYRQHAAEAPEAAPARGPLPNLVLPPAPFRQATSTELLLETIGGGPAMAPPAPAETSEPAPGPARQYRPAPDGLERPTFMYDSGRGLDRRAQQRETPERRSRPRMYASPWMAKPEGGLDPRPLRLPGDEPARDIRPLDTRMPQIPGMPAAPTAPAPAATGELSAPEFQYERTIHPEGEASADVPRTITPEVPAAVAVTAPAAPAPAAPATPAVTVAPAAPAPAEITFRPDEWFPAGQPMTTAPVQQVAPDGDALSSIFGGSDHSAGVMYTSAFDVPAPAAPPALVNPGMPARIQAAAVAPDAWFGHESAAVSPAAVSDGRSGVSALLYVVLPAMAGIGVGLLVLRSELQSYLPF